MYVTFYDDEDNTETFGPFDIVQMVYDIELRGISADCLTHTTIAHVYKGNLSGLWIDEYVGGVWKGFEVHATPPR